MPGMETEYQISRFLTIVKNLKDSDTNQNSFPLKAEARIMQVMLEFDPC